jgi:hypothetical protein
MEWSHHRLIHLVQLFGFSDKQLLEVVKPLVPPKNERSSSTIAWCRSSNHQCRPTNESFTRKPLVHSKNRSFIA